MGLSDLLPRTGPENASAKHVGEDVSGGRYVRSSRRRDVQGLRAIAILMVVFYHANLGVPGGFVGVDIFFVVSGYVISNLLLRTWADSGRPSLGLFYIRRVRRLLPALTTMTLCVLILSGIVISPLGTNQPAAGRAATAASAFLANAYFAVHSGGYFQPQAESNPFLHTWSLSVEEQFYIVFPALLFVAWRACKGRIRLLGYVALAFFAISLYASFAFTYDWLPFVRGLKTLSVHPDISQRVAFYMPFTRAWEFLAGVLITLFANGRILTNVAAKLSSAAGFVAIACSAALIHASDPFPGVAALLPVAGAVLVILAGNVQAQPILNRLLSSRAAVLVGDWSYSWYLWHWPVIVLVRIWYPGHAWLWAAAGFFALAPAVGSFYLIEEPIRHGRRWSSRGATALIGLGCICVPLGAGAALSTLASHNWGRSEISQIEAVVRPAHIDETLGCASVFPLGSAMHPPCIFTVPNAVGTVLLIGDSNAGHLAEPMRAAAAQLHMNLQVATDGGCPFLLRNVYSSTGCRTVVLGDLQYIAKSRPYSAIVISNSGSYVNVVGTGTRHARFVASWLAGLRATFELLSKRSPVIGVGAVPQFADMPNCLMRSVLQHGRPKGCGHLTPQQALTQRGKFVAAEKAGLASVAAGYVDTGKLLCSANGSCDVYHGNVLMYRDGSHLSVEGALLFEPLLQDALSSALGRPR